MDQEFDVSLNDYHSMIGTKVEFTRAVLHQAITSDNSLL